MDKLETINPLYGVTIGSTITSTDGKFSSTVVSKPISGMIKQAESYKSMSGASSYVYSDQLNQGSFGMAGSYGITGISKIKSSLAAYVGNSSAESSKSVTVNYNAISLAGVEYIKFGELTAADFLASLDLSCQSGSTKVLDAYNAVMAESAKLGVDIIQALSSNDPKYDELRKRVDSWVKESEKFVLAFGDGLVVGVAWGAFGAVTMEMTAGSSADSWKYGGQADFSYAGITSSVAVKNTYDGAQSSSNANVKVNCKCYVSGSVLTSQIESWFNQVANKSFSELADVKVMDKAPSMTISGGPPPIPEFEKPKVPSTIAGKVGEIKDLNGLNALAKASAFDEAKKKDPTLTLDKFLKESEVPADTNDLKKLREAISENEIDTLLFGNPPKLTKAAAKHEVNGASDKEENYVPLGVWISNWSDVFPWMAQGYYNSVDFIDEQAVKERTMLQDYQALSRLYYIANTAGVTEFKRKDPALPTISSLMLADTFANAAGKMQNMKQGDTETMKKIVESLGDAAKAIYTQWNQIAFLRNCELGLGLIKSKKTIGNILTDKSNADREVYSLSPCDFNGSNYTAFGRFYKVLPLLTPDGDIWAFGPEKGVLSSIYDTEIVFSKPGGAKFISFAFDKKTRTLSNDKVSTVLYPIPFSAADRVPWKGMSFSTNVGSFKSLNESLKQLNEQLDKLKAWTYSSANWDTDWNGKEPYRQKNIKKQYLGLIDEVKNIF